MTFIAAPRDMSAGKHFWIVRPPAKRPAGSCSPRILKKKAPVQAPSTQKGFTLLGVLLMVAATGAGLAAIGELASHALQREKEAELLFVGDQYREAIASYYRAQKTYPGKLDDLLEDKRAPMPRRHIRKLYRDPMTGQRRHGRTQPVRGRAGQERELPDAR
jgi:type II secretory pathway pseudopilin PulG